MSEYYLVVDSDAGTRAEWARAFGNTDIEVCITGSISEALTKWTAWYINGCVPRSVIVDWKTVESTEVCVKRERSIQYCAADGINRRGAQYLLHYCMEMSPHGVFVVYTADPRAVTQRLAADPVVGPHTMIAHKNKYMIKQVLEKIKENPVFIEQTSGFYNISIQDRA